MALDAGAELADMEFIQYHPTHAWWPYGVRGSVSESFRSEGGYLLNSEGERFMQRYDPERMELATRDMVSVAIYKEIRAGRGSKHRGIYATVAHLPPQQIEERLRVIFRKYMSYGYDIRKQPIEVRPRPHYHCGGVRINTRCETTVPGLYAAGAVTAGVHGANRLGSNSLTDILVFGEIAGRHAAERAHTLGGHIPENAGLVAKEIQRLAGLTDASLPKPLSTAPLRRKHIEMMDEHMGVLRHDEGMKTMLAEIQRTKREDLPRLRVKDDSRRYNFEIMDALEMFLRVEIEEMATQAALMRTESRGTHYREDYPERNDRDWLKNVVFTKRDGELCYEVRDVALTVTNPEEFPEYAAGKSPWH
jgi:fumarate reductase (CoM/CoB) subunit A